MNYMKQVAQMLGVELDEEFTINDSYNSIYKFTNNGLFWRCQGYWLPSDITFVRILCGKDEIIKKPILDDIERKYLSNVIKPFRDSVEYIIKNNAFSPVEWITIKYKDGGATSLPLFEKFTMYKGMEANKQYSLEELGL